MSDILTLAELGKLRRGNIADICYYTLQSAINNQSLAWALQVADDRQIAGQVFGRLTGDDTVDWGSLGTVTNVLADLDAVDIIVKNSLTVNAFASAPTYGDDLAAIYGGHAFGAFEGKALIKFTAIGSHTFTRNGLTSVEVLVVAGGGGSRDLLYEGGGGGGGLVYHSAKAITTDTITVTVGAGGIGFNNGDNSVFSDITAVGGGTSAANGGSGGGNRHNVGAGGTATQGNSGGGLGYGNNGGSATQHQGAGAGGGGAGSAGVDSPSGGYGKNGGDGRQYFGQYYAGGGGGGGLHGNGTGGLGNQFSNANGAQNLGGGANANNSSIARNGGSGIVVVRIPAAV